MNNAVQFPYIVVQNLRGETALRPVLPVKLSYDAVTIEANGLLDTGADVNVLPYQLGLSLGGIGNRQEQDCNFPVTLLNTKHVGFY